jgi:subtilisin family serine protease
MKRRFLPWLVLSTLLVTSAVADAGQFILRARTTADAETLCQRYNLVDVRTIHLQGADEICLVRSTTSSPANDLALKALIAADKLTESIEVDTSFKLAETASSASLTQSTAAILEQFAGQTALPFFGSRVSSAYLGQPAAAIVHVGPAQRFATGAGVVAIIDTGVDPLHPALAAALVPGYDFINGVPGFPSDFADLAQSTAAILEQVSSPLLPAIAVLNQSTAAILEQSTAAILEGLPMPAAFGHGTMVAGLVHLVAPTAWIMPLKAFRADGNAQLSDLVNAIYYAVDNGATVVNMSFTVASPSQALADAVAYAAANGVLCVAAAGNGGVQMDTFPASWAGVVSVASTTNTDQRSLFSNWGSRVDLSAPGEGLITTYPGGHYAAVWGTSFSTALVSGAVAIVHQFSPRISESDALKILEQGAHAPGGMGKARLDLYLALTEFLFQ